MANLSAKQQSFVKLMKSGEEYERHGYELILRRSDPETFFDALRSEGLFDPERNPGPAETERPGYFRIPHWPPLPYLEAVAKLAGESNNLILASKIMEVVRGVTNWRDKDERPRDNYGTWFAFARILGLLPPSAISLRDIDMLSTWLSGSFDHSMVGHALASGTLQKFLHSNERDDWLKAVRILYFITALRPMDAERSQSVVASEVRTIVDDSLLKELINQNATDFGKQVGLGACDVFLTRIKETFVANFDGNNTWLYRPAIEEHDQNWEWRGPYNRLVEGLRDTLLAWLDVDLEPAKKYVDALINSGSEIVERIAIHVLDRRFERLRDLVPKIFSPRLFDTGHKHELYLFLSNHFSELGDHEKAAVLEIIRNLPLRDGHDDAERARQSVQQSWLAAIKGQNYEPAEIWYNELSKSLNRSEPFHPDFNSYHESHWGFGPTPHKAEELVTFAQAGTLVDQLDAFKPTNLWDGPTTRSLADTLENAVGKAPPLFLEQLSKFLSTKPAYQYAVIAGFKKLWDAWDGKGEQQFWQDAWPVLMKFFEKLIGDERFWHGEVKEEPTLTPTRDWIPSVISEFLRAGTRTDDKAYPPGLLPRGLSLLVILLNKSEAQKETDLGDPLTRAINSPKGKAIEALLDHALRSCRLADKQVGTHGSAWTELEPLFDAELAKCTNGNFEFSAIAGAYIANFQYMNPEWVHSNFGKIFAPAFPENCLSALGGLAFAPPSKPIFDDLSNNGTIDWALKQTIQNEHARENLLQRLALAYLWDQEQLDGPRFAYIFDAKLDHDLGVISNYFWMVRGQELIEIQKQRIFQFWDRCIVWAQTLESPPKSLLSTLSLLTCYLSEIDSTTLRLLLGVAPYTPVNYNADRFIEALGRLAEKSPREVAIVLAELLQKYRPDYDFEDRLKALIVLLANHADTRRFAISSLERVRHLPGMIQLYSELSSQHPDKK